MPSEICIAGIGEVLVDVFENGEVTVGGAPFNVTFHVHQLLAALSLGEGVFVSAVGHDSYASSIRCAAERAAMSTRYLAEVDRPTGSALVFERNGGAGFEIKPDVAWDYIDIDQWGMDLAARCDAVVFGSLGQRAPQSRESIRRFVSAVKGHRLYDVNLRRNTTDGAMGYSEEIIRESLELATVVKMNDSEIDEVCAVLGNPASGSGDETSTRQLMEWLRKSFSLEAIAVTRGAKGALLLAREHLLTLPDSQLDQKLVRPVGAGDAFAAGLLFGVVRKWEPSRCLQLASVLSNWVVLQASATPALSSEVLAAIREQVARETAYAGRE